MKTLENETAWDKLLKIKTTGRDDSCSDQYKYPYEPTPYVVLERFANSGEIGKKNVVLDYGCGKGRVSFYLSYQTKCKSIGIDFDERMIQTACANQKTAVSGNRIRFEQGNAEAYTIPEDVDRFFFFNPFSVDILQKVIARILDSYYEDPREMKLYFYYPSDEYIAWLMTVEELSFEDELDCMDLFEGGNPRERIVVFSIDGY